MSEVVTFGETMALLTAPRTGRLRDMASLDLSIAGAESNVCIAVARLGRSAAWLGRVGADEFGELVLTRLRAEQVAVEGATVDSAAPTGLMVKERRRANTARVTYYRRGSAASLLVPEHLDLASIGAARILHVTGITPALGAGPRAAVHAAVAHARAAGVLVSFDVNYRSALWPRDEAGAEFAALAAKADIVFAGEEEMTLLGAGDPLEMGRLLVDKGARAVVIKRGAAGACSVTAAGVFDAPAVAVQALDPVGAGDAFVGGYLVACLEDADEQERLALGCAVGAFAVSSIGDWEGLPSRSDLKLLGADGTTER